MINSWLALVLTDHLKAHGYATLTMGSPSPRTEFLHHTSNGDIEGIRQSDWKLPVKNPNAKKPKILLFNLKQDIGETTNLAASHPEKTAALRARVTTLDSKITAAARPPGGTFNH